MNIITLAISKLAKASKAEVAEDITFLFNTTAVKTKTGTWNLLRTSLKTMRQVVTVTASSHTAVDRSTVLVDATAAAATVNLPNPGNSKDFSICVKKIDATANTVTLDPGAAVTIDGAATKVLNAQYENVRVDCDGSNWWIID